MVKKNGKEKEYYKSDIIFEGEYLNGKKWNGKRYYKNNLIYELKNEKGYIKEYNICDGKLRFEGQYINWDKNGKGREYIFGHLIFEGEYKNGKRNGKGKEYNNSGKLVYESEYKKEKEMEKENNIIILMGN